MSLIVDIQYFPSITFFKVLKEQTHVVFEQYEMFQKGSFRNRCVVFGANGLISLTVPIAGGREQKVPIRETEIDYSQQWQRTHLRSLQSAYNKSPFFPFYYEELAAILYTNEKYLFDLDLKVIRYLITCLKINCTIRLTSEYNLSYPNAIDARNSIRPKSYKQDPGNWSPKYAQVFEEKWGFQANLSILDLLFCEGPNAGNVL
jgi:hypothetical protein